MKLQTFLLKQKPKNNTPLIKKIFFHFPILKCKVLEESMQPLLNPGDMIVVNRFRKGKTGDIIVLKNPEKESLQRYLIKQIEREENNKVYVLGINQKVSIDSRQFGWIQKKDIIGKMILKI